jgi:glucose/arabinose dehydrogenase
MERSRRDTCFSGQSSIRDVRGGILMIRTWFIFCLLLGFSLFGLADNASAAAVGLQRVASGLNRPIYVTHAPGDADRLFIVEKGGTIKIMDLASGAINATPFLTVPDTDASGNEEGLLGLAFHPEYATNGKFYINVTVDDDGGVAATRTHIREYTVSSNPDVALPTPIEVLGYNQPQENHNGGWLGFSPNDGYLYIMAGDGGGGNDTGTGHTSGTGNAQDITSNLLGKVLRIDVDGTNGSTGNYGNPADNPFVGETGDDEIWAYGLRNPWRASFDRQTGDLWIGDVGQSAREEIDFQPADSDGGENYGWRILEGSIQNPAYPTATPPANAVPPIYDYARGTGDFQGFAVAGGYSYRGPDPELQGLYFFADSGSSNIWTLDRTPSVTVDNIESDIPPNTGTLNGIVSFAEDAIGNLYVVNIGSGINNPPVNTGSIYKLVTDAFVPGDFNADGLVDGDDLSRWQAGYGTLTGAQNANGDADGDGDVDGRDFLAWQRNLGVSSQDFSGDLTSPAVAVPEPGAVILLGMTVVCCGRRSALRA